jgi:hypothetical protein
MALVHSPSITTRNLVLNYDFANIKSYSGSGSTVVSSIPGVTAGTLTNSPTFNDGLNAGVMSFDGTDDFATFDIGLSNLAEPMTIEIWCNIKRNNATQMLCSWSDYAIFLPIDSLRIGYNTANSDSYGFNFSSNEVINTWSHFIFEMRSDVSYTNNKIYHNAVNKTLTNPFENSFFRTFNNGLGRIACRTPTAENLFIQADIGVFRIYKGALSQDEITRNFTALRGRYGL